MERYKQLICIIILLIIGYQFYNMGVKSVDPIEKEMVKTDTIIKTDTIRIIEPIPQYVTKIKTVKDTLRTTDTIPQYVEVEVPIEQKTYKDSSYYAVISGYKASLDTLEVFPKETTITIEKTSYIKDKKKFGVGLQVGYGFDPIHKQSSPYIGVGIQYNLFKF